MKQVYPPRIDGAGSAFRLADYGLRPNVKLQPTPVNGGDSPQVALAGLMVAMTSPVMREAAACQKVWAVGVCCA